MAILPIITVPDPLLKTVCAPVETVDDGVRALLDDMLETMYAAPGIGLAAIQIAEPKRLVVMDLAAKDEEPDPRFFINPQIVETSEETVVNEEGCLSIPGYYDEVERPARALVRYQNRDGAQIEEWAEGLYSVCIQHEVDHLNGTLFIDYLSRLKRDRAVRKVQKMAADQARSATS